jgi:phenylalanine-4-hydroxylase
MVYELTHYEQCWQRLAPLPEHLVAYVSCQHWERYTETDHAVWGYLATSLTPQLRGRAIEPFFEGVWAFRFDEPRIPKLAELNLRLRRHRWETVPVGGMLRPHIWIDFVANRRMPIVVGIRTHENLRFAPTPDIFPICSGTPRSWAGRSSRTCCIATRRCMRPPSRCRSVRCFPT